MPERIAQLPHRGGLRHLRQDLRRRDAGALEHALALAVHFRLCVTEIVFQALALLEERGDLLVHTLKSDGAGVRFLENRGQVRRLWRRNPQETWSTPFDELVIRQPVRRRSPNSPIQTAVRLKLPCSRCVPNA